MQDYRYLQFKFRQTTLPKMKCTTTDNELLDFQIYTTSNYLCNMLTMKKIMKGATFSKTLETAEVRSFTKSISAAETRSARQSRPWRMKW